MSFRELKLRSRIRTRQAEITELIDYQQFCGIPGVSAEHDAGGEPFARITVTELRDRRLDGWTPFVLDVRKPHEAEIASVPFVDRLEPHETVARIAGELPTDRDIVVMCKSGGRSARAAAALVELGFSRVHNVEGGINAWAREIDGTVPLY